MKLSERRKVLKASNKGLIYQIRKTWEDSWKKEDNIVSWTIDKALLDGKKSMRFFVAVGTWCEIMSAKSLLLYYCPIFEIISKEPEDLSVALKQGTMMFFEDATNVEVKMIKDSEEEVEGIKFYIVDIYLPKELPDENGEEAETNAEAEHYERPKTFLDV